MKTQLSTRARKSGFTLIELMVYVAILGIIVIVAGQAFVDSSRFRVRTENMIKSSEESARVSSLLKEDMEQMGAKSWYDESEGKFKTEFTTGEWSLVYMSEEDTSSFAFGSATDPGRGGQFDDIRFNKIKYNEGGEAVAVQQIRWFVDNGVLHRTCSTLNGAGADDCGAKNAAAKEVTMADGVTRFSLVPSQPDSSAGAVIEDDEEILFPNTSPSVPSFHFISREEETASLGGSSNFEAKWVFVENNEELDSLTAVILKGFKTNYNPETPIENITTRIAQEVFLAGGDKFAEDNDWSSNCNPFNFAPGETYAVRFKLGFNDDFNDYMRDFRPGVDHLAVGFRNQSDGERNIIPDFLIYPPQVEDDQKIRYLEFSVPTEINNVCLSVTAAFYSPRAHMGEIEIENLKVVRKLDELYRFDDDFDPKTQNEKRNVKAFKLFLDIEKRGEVGQSVLVIPTPNNGIVVPEAAATP